jgi:hypothetical protein
MNEKQKQALFGIWDKIGISAEHLKYLGIPSIDPRVYFDLMQEYLGVEPDTAVGSNRTYFQNLEEHIISDVNRKFFPDNAVKPSECGDYRVKLWRLSLDKSTTMHFYMMGKHYKLLADFLYSYPEDFKCPQEDKDESCFDEYCLEPLVFPVGGYLFKKYGISVNYNMIKADTNGNVFKLVAE